MPQPASYLIPAVRLCILDDCVLRWEYSLGFRWGVGDSQEASWVQHDGGWLSTSLPNNQPRNLKIQSCVTLSQKWTIHDKSEIHSTDQNLSVSTFKVIDRCVGQVFLRGDASTDDDLASRRDTRARSRLLPLTPFNELSE